MTCGTQGKFVGPYISDPYALAQAELECNGLCSINQESCVADYAASDCSISDNVPDNFPVNI